MPKMSAPEGKALINDTVSYKNKKPLKIMEFDVNF